MFGLNTGVKMDFMVKNEDLIGKMRGAGNKIRNKMIVPYAWLMAVEQELSRKKRPWSVEPRECNGTFLPACVRWHRALTVLLAAVRADLQVPPRTGLCVHPSLPLTCPPPHPKGSQALLVNGLSHTGDT